MWGVNMKLITESAAYLDEFLELVYPSNIKCICCDGELENKADSSICEYCKSKIKFEPSWSNLHVESEYFRGLVKILTVAEYSSTIRKLIYKFKYNSQTYIARELANIMAAFLEVEKLSFDMVIPVPLFVAKKRKRGFNQAELLAKYLSKQIKTQCANDVVARTKDTATMHRLTKQQRRENVRGVFDVTDPTPILFKNILLVDDIYTTGATIKECSEMLLNAGAEKVTAIAFARSVLE